MKTEEIIREFYPKLITNELVSIQPMNCNIFCLKHQEPTIPEWVIESDDEKILNENNSVVDKINTFCSLKNLKCVVKVNKIHDFMEGWYKGLSIEITEKSNDLG